MLGLGWLTVRQAQEALKNGRLEDAHRLLGQSACQGHKRSWELQGQLARAFVERGERHLEREEATKAWHDLVHAEQLGTSDGNAGGLRQALTKKGLAEVRQLLDAGEPGLAGDAIARLRERSVRQPELTLLEEAAKDWGEAQELAGRGEFARALQTVDRLRRLLPAPVRALDKFQRDLERARETFAPLLVELHEAVEQARWREVVQLSDQALALAPQHAEARRARSRAWKVIEPVTVAVAGSSATPAPVSSQPEPAAPRFLLWIDGVGGYLVCLGNRVTLGQATPESHMDVPLYADVSRHHATLTRDSEGYLLEAVRPMQVNGRPVEKTLLQSGDRITLGATCQLQFRQPVAVSASARLDLASGHRPPLAVDAVLLMADTLVLGPGSHVHVPMPDLAQPVVLYRHKEGLGIRYPGR